MLSAPRKQQEIRLIYSLSQGCPIEIVQLVGGTYDLPSQALWLLLLKQERGQWAEPEANKEGERGGLRKVFPEEILGMMTFTENQWCTGKWFIDSSMLKKKKKALMFSVC